MLLGSSLEDFKYDVNEFMFLLKAIFRMVWQPMVPLLALTSFLSTMKTLSAVANSRVLCFFETTLEYSWYGACFNVIVVFVLTVISEQVSRVKYFVDNEIARFVGALEIILFRLPLLNDGLQNNYRIRQAQDAVDDLMFGLKSLFSIFSELACVVSVLITLYVQIGWVSFAPLVICFTYRQLEYYVAKIGGTDHMWEFYNNQNNYDDKIDEIFYSIKSIKMFGWKGMYTDPKLQKHWKCVEAKKYDTWYTSFSNAILTLFNILGLGASDLSVYIIVLFMRNDPYFVAALPTADIFQLSELIHILQVNFNNFLASVANFYNAVKTVYIIEQILYRASQGKQVLKSRKHILYALIMGTLLRQ